MRIFVRAVTAVAIVLVAIVTSAAAHAQGLMTKDQLFGTWQLLSFKATSGDKVSYPLGEQPKGFIEFTASRFWVMLVDSTRKPPAATALTDAEAATLMKSHAAYTGKYDVDPAQTPDGIKITIQVGVAPNEALNGTRRVFFTRVDGNKLILKSPAIVVPTTGLTSVVHLEFVKAD
jgi:hypothetical protein